MQSFAFKRARLLASLAAVLCLLAPLRAQDAAPPPPPAQEAEEVVRVSSELVQTDVMVFNKEGGFVDGLKPEEFELKVDGRVQPIAFFERVEAGAVNEDAQLAAARGGARTTSRPAGAPVPLDRGRTVVFFVDDLHLSAGSAMHTRRALLRFVDEELRQNDEAAVASASGQVGFLQQFTDDRTVLRTAVGRIQPRAYSLSDGQQPPMSELHALAINRYDIGVTGYFVDALLRESPVMSREAAENTVRGRAREIMRRSQQVTSNTLYSLEALVRYSAPLPGRKLLFFISDGFLVDTQEDMIRDRLRRITDAAARAGVVIYTMDAGGLRTGTPDATSEAAFDPTGRLASTDSSEIRTKQEPLRTLAADTGGRALINTNAMGPAVEGALKETSRYYLLAWRPEAEGSRGAVKFRRIEVSVRGRKDLNVMMRRGLYVGDAPPEAEARDGGKRRKNDDLTKATAQTAAETVADRELRSALGAPRPVSSLPASLSVGFVDVPEQGAIATVSVGLEPEAASLLGAQPDGRAHIDVAAVIFNDRGQYVSGFKQGLSVAPLGAGAEPREQLVQSHQFKLAPGLYQVRVAVRDRQTRRAGSAIEWIEIPNFKQGQFALSSIFLAERTGGGATDKLKPEQLTDGVLVNVGRRFSRGSWMRFVTFVYNASKGAARPDVALQVQVFRDDQPVLTAPLARVNSELATDAARLPYAAEIPLNSFPTGRYVLQLTAIDRAAKTTTRRRIDFTVE